MTPLEAALEMVARGVIEVRPDGTVWKCRNVRGTSLAVPRRMETRAKSGYSIVKVCSAGRQFVVTAHRLVWTVTRGAIPEGADLNHRDGNERNNDPTNLEIVTRSENIQHAWTAGLRKRTDTPRDVADQARMLRAEGRSFAQIAAALGVSQTTAFRAAKLK